MTFIFSKKTTNHISGLVTQLRHLRYIFDFISMLCFLCNKVFSRQPCCMAGATDSFSYGKKLSFLCKIFPLFLPCNMAAVQNLMYVIYFEYDFYPSSMMDTPRALLSLVMVNLSLLNLTTMAIPWKRFLLIKERSV